MTASILVPLELHVCEAGFAFCVVQLLKAVAESLCKIMVQNGAVSPWYSGSAVQSGIRDFLSHALLNICPPKTVLLAAVGLHTIIPALLGHYPGHGALRLTKNSKSHHSCSGFRQHGRELALGGRDQHVQEGGESRVGNVGFREL